MTAKKYLNQIRTLDILIMQKRQEVDELHDIATAIGSFDYSRDRVQTSPSGEAPYTRTAERAMELDKEIRRLLDERQVIIDRIQSMSDRRYVEVLYKRYVEYKPFEDIAREMGYVLSYIWQLHSEALNAFI